MPMASSFLLLCAPLIIKSRYYFMRHCRSAARYLRRLARNAIGIPASFLAAGDRADADGRHFD